jgi:hypothetical protein
MGSMLHIYSRNQAPRPLFFWSKNRQELECMINLNRPKSQGDFTPAELRTFSSTGDPVQALRAAESRMGGGAASASAV